MNLFHVELLLIAYLTLLVVHWLSPLALAPGKRRMPVAWIRHAKLQMTADALEVDFYLANDIHGYAFSCWLGFRRAVIFDEKFFAFGPEGSIEFVLAHELAHHRLGHVTGRILLSALLLDWLKPMKMIIAHTEESANRWAEQVTNLPRSIVWGVGIPMSRAGGPGYSTEEHEA